MAKAPRILETPEETKIIRAGEKAVEILKRSFEHWMEIARALEAGRQACLREADIEPDTKRGEEGGGFSKVYSRWLTQHPKLKLSDKAATEKVIRSWLFKCLEHEDDIKQWRSTQGIVELSRFSFPETVFKHWAKDTDFIDTDAKPKRGRKKKQDEKQRDQTLDWARQEIKDTRDRAGDWDNDTANQIVEKLESYYPGKMAEVVGIVMDESNLSLDWDAPEEVLVETLYGMIPHNDKSLRVLRQVADRIEVLVAA